MPALGSQHPGRIQLLDVTKQRKSFEFYYDAVTALSIAGLLTELGALESATDGITIGTIAETEYTIDRNVLSNTPPTDQAAQIGSALLVQYQDTTTEQPFSLNIPCVDYSKLNFIVGGGNQVIFSGAGASTEIAAWVTAFEAVASPPGSPTHNVAVTGMRYNSKRE